MDAAEQLVDALECPSDASGMRQRKECLALVPRDLNVILDAMDPLHCTRPRGHTGYHHIHNFRSACYGRWHETEICAKCRTLRQFHHQSAHCTFTPSGECRKEEV